MVPMSSSSDSARLDLTPSDDPELRQAFISAMGGAAASVTVITTDGAAGRLGQTVTAMMSVCAEPPTLVIGLYRGVPVADAVRTNRCFAVNVLAHDDVQLARDFAGQNDFETRYKFGEGWTSLRTGSPARLGAAAVFDCHAEQFLTVGTHLLIVGRVVSVSSQAVPTLTYMNRSYGQHVPLEL